MLAFANQVADHFPYDVYHTEAHLGKPRSEWFNPSKPSVMEMEEATISLDSPQSLIPVMTFLRDHTTCAFKQVVERAAIDYPGRMGNRFDVVYCLLSRTYNARLKVVVRTDEYGVIPSLTKLYSGTGWLEREVYDRHGIFFEGNSDLRRILTDYGFQGHPLRKDFPLTGYYEVRYDELEKRVLYEPVESAQEFREFSFNNPWRTFGDEVDSLTSAEGSSVKTVSAPRPADCDFIYGKNN
jgi:NADH-quinone oxidoreductase subunit C